MKNLLNNISQEEKNRILMLHESSSKKTVLKETTFNEQFLINEGRMSEVFSKIFGKFNNEEKENLSNELEDNLGVTSDNTKEEIEDKLRDKFGDVEDPSTFKKIIRTLGGGVDDIMSNFLDYAIQVGTATGFIKYFDNNILAYLAVVIAWYLTRFVFPGHGPSGQGSKFVRTFKDSDYKEKGPGLKGFDNDYYKSDNGREMNEAGYDDLKNQVNKRKDISTKVYKSTENLSVIVGSLIKLFKLDLKRLSPGEISLDRDLLRKSHYLMIELKKLEELIESHKRKDINNPLTSEDLEFYDIDVNDIMDRASELSSMIEDLNENTDYFGDDGKWLSHTERLLDRLAETLSRFVK
jgi:hypothetical protein